MENSGYHLRLSAQHSWYIASDSASLDSWLRKTAAIMELEAGTATENEQRIICITETDYPELPFHFAASGAILSDIFCHDMSMLRTCFCGEIGDAVCILDSPDNEKSEIIAARDVLYPVYRSVIEKSGLPFHAALIEHEGKGVLLAAPGGTGKSTCFRRVSGKWNGMCDDEVLVIPAGDRFFQVHPFPTWSEYLWKRSERTWNVQRSVPLHAVFFINQAEEDHAEPVGQGEASYMMFLASMQIWQKYLRKLDTELKRAYRSRLFSNAVTLSLNIPAFRLGVSLEGRFWEEIERVLGW